MEKVITQFEALGEAKQPANGNVLLIGGPNARRWTEIDDYFPDHNVLNCGFGGARLYEILKTVSETGEKEFKLKSGFQSRA